MIYRFGNRKSTFSLLYKKILWTQLQQSFQNVLIISPITPQSTIFGFADYKVNYHLMNHNYLYFNTRG